MGSGLVTALFQGGPLHGERRSVPVCLYIPVNTYPHESPPGEYRWAWLDTNLRLGTMRWFATGDQAVAIRAWWAANGVEL